MQCLHLQWSTFYVLLHTVPHFCSHNDPIYLELHYVSQSYIKSGNLHPWNLMHSTQLAVNIPKVAKHETAAIYPPFLPLDSNPHQHPLTITFIPLHNSQLN